MSFPKRYLQGVATNIVHTLTFPSGQILIPTVIHPGLLLYWYRAVLDIILAHSSTSKLWKLISVYYGCLVGGQWVKTPTTVAAF